MCTKEPKDCIHNSCEGCSFDARVGKADSPADGIIELKLKCGSPLWVRADRIISLQRCDSVYVKMWVDGVSEPLVVCQSANEVLEMMRQNRSKS